MKGRPRRQFFRLVWPLLAAGLFLAGCGQGSNGGSSWPSFSIGHAGAAVSKTWTEITVSVRDSSELPWTDFIGTITLSTTSSNKDQVHWRNKTGQGTFDDSAGSADEANYTYIAEDTGEVTFEIMVDEAQTLKINAIYNGETEGTSADLVIGGGGGGGTAPSWFPWWLGDEAATCNANNCDRYAPVDGNSAGWVGIYPVAGTTQDSPAELLHTGNNKGLNDRLSQGFTKISIEAERTLSRDEIRALISWCRDHPTVTVFLWIMSYNQIAPYEVYQYKDWTGTFPTPDNISKRVYFYWEEYADCPDNLVLCFELYYCQPDVLGGDFINKEVMAQREITYLEENYWRFIVSFDLEDHCLGVLGLGGPNWGVENFTSVDLEREMNLVKSYFPLGIGFFSGAREWAFTGAVAQADQFCRDWLDEYGAAGSGRKTK